MKHKVQDNHDKRRASPPNSVVRSTNLRKSSATSVSTVDLRKIDEQFSNIKTSQSQRKPKSRGSSPIRNQSAANSKVRKSESSDQVKNNQKNLSVQFFTKPQRSKTAIDIKANGSTRSSIPRSVQSPIQQQQQHQQQQHSIHSHLPPTNAILQPTPHHHHLLQQHNAVLSAQQFSSSHHHHLHHEATTMLGSSFNSSNYETSSESQDIVQILSGHDMMFNTLCNRITSLDMIRNQMR